MQPSQTIQKFTFEGPLTLGQSVILGLVVAGFTGFFTLCECKASGSRQRFAFLFGARLVALAFLCWMLAGATVTTLLREIKPGSILMLVDSSASMGLVDPVDGSGNAVSWCAAQKRTQSLATVATLDHIIGKLRASQAAVRQLERRYEIQEFRQGSQILLEELTRSITSAVTELGQLTLDSPRNNEESRAELNRASAFLKSGLASVRLQIEKSTPGNRKNLKQSQTNGIEETEAFLDAGLRRLEHIARELASNYEINPTPQEQAILTSQSKLGRKDKVTDWLEASEGSWMKELGTRSRILRYAFASKVLSVPENGWRLAFASNDPVAGTTDISAVLDRAVQDSAQQSITAVVLVTDGGHNASGNPLQIATSLRGLPFYVVPVGDRKMPRDAILHHTHCPRTVFKNDMLMVDAMVTAYDCEGEKLRVELLNGNTLVDSKNLAISSKFFDSRLEFKWKATELGHQTLKIRIVPLAGEHSLENNDSQAEVEVMEDTIRVLVADGRPRWEFRYLVNLFKRDKHIQFEQLLFEPRDESAPTPSLPRDAEGWRRYRIVILGDLTPEQLSPEQQDFLKKFVAEEAGNLIVIGGDIAMPFAFAEQPLLTMLPTLPGAALSDQEQPRTLMVTAEGRLSPATQLDEDPLASDRIWREMSSKVPVYLSGECQPKLTSHVLISAALNTATQNINSSEQKTEAFLSWQYVGLGRVVYVAAPVTYQLRYRNGDTYHHRFWGQLLRWAIAREMSTGSRTVRLGTDKSGYEKGDTAQLTVQLSHPDGGVVSGGQARIEAQREGQIFKLLELHEDTASPGTYRGTLEDLPLGPIKLRAAGSTVQSLLTEEKHPDPIEQTLTVDPKGSTELSNPLCNMPLLTQLVDAGGGAILSPASIPAALSEIHAPPDVVETVLRRQPAWNRWLYFWIFIGCVTAEWVARKYWRMG